MPLYTWCREDRRMIDIRTEFYRRPHSSQSFVAAVRGPRAIYHAVQVVARTTSRNSRPSVYDNEHLLTTRSRSSPAPTAPKVGAYVALREEQWSNRRHQRAPAGQGRSTESTVRSTASSLRQGEADPRVPPRRGHEAPAVAVRAAMPAHAEVPPCTRKEIRRHTLRFFVDSELQAKVSCILC